MITTLILAALLAAPAALQDGAELNLHYLQGSYYLQTDRPALAVEELRKAAEQDPDSAQLQTTLGRALVASGDIDGSLAAFEHAIELDPSNPEPYKIIGRVLLAQLASDPDNEAKAARAEEVLKRAAELDVTDVESRYFLSMVYSGIGDVEKQYEALKSAADLDPGRPEILQRTAEVARDLGKVREANRFFNRAGEVLQTYAERFTDNMPLQLQLGELSLWNTRKFDIAVRAYNRVITQVGDDESRRPFRIEAEIGKATALYLMEDYEPAFRLFDKNERFVMANLGAFGRSIPYMVFTFARHGDAERALEILDQLQPRDDQNNEDLRNYLLRIRGVALDYGGRTDEAIELFEERIAADPEDIENFLSLAQVHLNEQAYDEAAKVVSRAEAVFGEQHNDIMFVKAVILERQGRREEALEIFHALIAQDPDNDLALNYAGYTLAEMEQDLQRAEDYLKRALELEPNQGSYLDSLGWIYYKMGDFELAERYLTQALGTKYKSAEVREHLGYLYMKFGRTRQALEEFEAAIANNLAEVKPTDEVEGYIRQLREKLENR